MNKLYLTILCSTVLLSNNLYAQFAPRVDSVKPIKASPGTAVTIYGSNFGSSPALNTVYFGSVKASVASVMPGVITVTVPNGPITHRLQ